MAKDREESEREKERQNRFRKWDREVEVIINILVIYEIYK